MGYLKSSGTVVIYIGLILALIAFLPGIPPDAQFSEYSILSPPLALKGNLGENKRLDDAEILFKGELKGPESFASYNGELYTTLHGGDVVKIVGKHIVPVVKFGKPCAGLWMEKECGRPLGLQFDKTGVLYVSDAYYGIYKVDVTSGKYEKIVDISKPIEGVVPKLSNSLDIASNGDIYWSDSSREYLLQDGVYACLANPSGRLIRYDAATKRNVVLVNNLNFANGVKLSKDESFVVVAETLSSSLIKFHLKGSKAGRAEPFVQGLPGLPDNIHTDGDDGFLVSLVSNVDADHPGITQTLAPHPHIRRLLSRLLYLLEAPFKLVQDVYPNIYSERATHWIGHFESIGPLHTVGVTVLRIDASGKVIDALYSKDGKCSSISSAFIFKDHLYLGSPFNEYLARVPLKQAFPLMKPVVQNIVREKVVDKREVKEPPKPSAASTPPPQTTPKPVTTTPKPITTTTTPKPTTTTPKPTTTTPKPTTTTPKPTTTTPKPTTATPKPVTSTPKPTQTPAKEPASSASTTPRPPQQQQQQQQQQRQQQQRQQQQHAAAKPTKSAEPVPRAPALPPVRNAPVKEATPKPADKPSNVQTSPPPPNNAQKVRPPPSNAPKSPPSSPSNAQNTPPPPSNAQKTAPPRPPQNSEELVKSVEVKTVKEPEVKKTEQTKEAGKSPVATPTPPRN